MRGDIPEDAGFILRNPLLDEIQPFVNHHSFRDDILVTPGRNVLQELFRVVHIIDQNHRLWWIDGVVNPSHKHHPENDNQKVDKSQFHHRARMGEESPPAD